MRRTLRLLASVLTINALLFAQVAHASTSTPDTTAESSEIDLTPLILAAAESENMATDHVLLEAKDDHLEAIIYVDTDWSQTAVTVDSGLMNNLNIGSLVFLQPTEQISDDISDSHDVPPVYVIDDVSPASFPIWYEVFTRYGDWEYWYPMGSYTSESSVGLPKVGCSNPKSWSDTCTFSMTVTASASVNTSLDLKAWQIGIDASLTISETLSVSTQVPPMTRVWITPKATWYHEQWKEMRRIYTVTCYSVFPYTEWWCYEEEGAVPQSANGSGKQPTSVFLETDFEPLN